ncbi:MSHA biogenesis protein MshG [Rhodopirellula maiorica SM1]|uniref:MSHA biogenesis protein MshG n=1 Tax=Rhodopirellula maiorica SM1 TaxID=1265738 RepID=M5S2N7_9BACT|nr:type II secretion system F family protein [Rhodopirellula maiorica]EMI21897.1 MSHA biogenesis protein MshG [Rhodopirellula maiorica SM1]
MPIYVPSPDSTIRQQVEDMLLQRDELIAVLAALADEMPRGRSRRELTLLVRRLREGASANALLSDPATAVWLTHASVSRKESSPAAKMVSAIAYANSEADSRSHFRYAMLYPTIVILLAVIVLVVLAFTVVPSFAKMYDEFGLRLPAPTRLLVWFSEAITTASLASLAVIAAIVVAAIGIYQLSMHFSLGLRLFGRFAAGNTGSVAAMAKLVSQLAEMLEMGASLPESLWFAGQTCGNRHLRNLAVQLANHVNQGSLPLRESSVAHQLPANVIDALSVAPDAKPNTILLHEISAMYRQRASSRVNWFSGIASPLATLAVAAVVAFVVFSLFTPLVSLVSGLT